MTFPHAAPQRRAVPRRVVGIHMAGARGAAPAARGRVRDDRARAAGSSTRTTARVQRNAACVRFGAATIKGGDLLAWPAAPASRRSSAGQAAARAAPRESILHAVIGRTVVCGG